MKITVNFKMLLLYLYAFVIIYVPNLSYYIKVNGVVIFVAMTGAYLLKYLISRDKTFFKYFKTKVLLSFILFNIMFTIYFTIRTSLAGVSLLDFYNLRIFQNMIPVIVLISIVIVYHELNLHGYSKKEKYQFIINIAFIQGLIALSMVVFPSLRQIAYNIFYQGNDNINIYIYASRLYGICDGNYTYSFQTLQSFLALFALYFAYFFKEKKYYAYSLIIFLVTILNGRTGIIVYAIGFIILLLYVLLKEHKVLLFLRILLVSLILGLVAIKSINYILPNTARLMNHAINDILTYTNGGTTEFNETSHLLGMMKLPNGILNKIFGSGYRIYAGYGERFNYFGKSDIGFVNDIFMGGIFYILLVYGSIFMLVKYVYINNKLTTFEKVFSNILIVSMCISNFKGELFRSQMQIATVLIILVFMMFKEEKNVEILDNNSSV